MQNIRFSVYNHKLVDKRGNLISRPMIVLKDQDGDIVGWTDFHKYARSGKKARSRSIYSGKDNRCTYVSLLLNYVFFDKYHITRLIDMTPEMVKSFLTDFGLCRLPRDPEDTHRNEETVNLCISIIEDFIDLLSRENPKCKVSLKDLFKTEKVFDRRKRRYTEKNVPIFEINFLPSKKKILRDLTENAFQIIMNEIAANHRNILMLAAASAFAGLRPSEACNMRREDSPLGQGIFFEKTDGETTKITIDLTEEKNLRSDLVHVGDIKKERTAKVYPAFLEAFVDCYNQYMKYIEGRPYETEYGALTNTSFGMAYTYDSYYKEFQKVANACIPIMLSDSDPQTVHFGHLLLEHNIGPHILRHWFSVKLTLYGESVGNLMSYRGDKSPESALTYQQNKSELTKQLKIVSDEAFNYNLWRATKIIEEDNDKSNRVHQ